jgi:hypothetical protein
MKGAEMRVGPLKGTAIAGALAAMIAGGLANAQDKPAKPEKAEAKTIHCEGTNDCKGKGGCKSAKNDCKGQNSCKGQSFTMEKTAKDCTAKGGKVVEPKKS